MTFRKQSRSVARQGAISERQSECIRRKQKGWLNRLKREVRTKEGPRLAESIEDSFLLLRIEVWREEERL